MQGWLNSKNTTDRNSIIEALSSLNAEDLLAVNFIGKSVLESVLHLKPGKCHGTDLSSDHFIHAAPDLLAALFTALVHHGYMPEPISYMCPVLVPIPKSHKDPSLSDNYRPIALAPTLSKVLEWAVLLHYSDHFCTSDLQFGFKK